MTSTTPTSRKIDDVTRRAAANAVETVKLTNVRLCSANVFEPVAIGGSEALRYRAEIVIPLDDPAWEAVAEDVIGKIQQVWRLATGSEDFPEHNMISRGDDKRGRDGKPVPGLQNTIIISASNVDMPTIVGEAGEIVRGDDGSIYGGATVFAILRFYAMVTGTRPGVYAELCALKHLKHGQSLGFARHAVQRKITIADFDDGKALGAGLS